MMTLTPSHCSACCVCVQARSCFFLWLNKVPSKYIDAVHNANDIPEPKPSRYGVPEWEVFGNHTNSNDTDAEARSRWLTGAWAEAFLYRWLSKVLPGFSTNCWTSHNRRILGYRVPWNVGPDTPYDFDYTAPNNLSTASNVIRAGSSRYKINCKACQGSAVLGGGSFLSLRDIRLSPRQWDCAQEMHAAKGALGVYVIVLIERVSPQFVPRLVAVLEDPYGMMLEGKIWVQPVIIDSGPGQQVTKSNVTSYKISFYPLLPGSLGSKDA